MGVGRTSSSRHWSCSRFVLAIFLNCQQFKMKLVKCALSVSQRKHHHHQRQQEQLVSLSLTPELPKKKHVSPLLKDYELRRRRTRFRGGHGD